MMSKALTNYTAAASAAILRLFAFRATMTGPEWAERVRRMEHGRYHFDFAPYQREMMATPYKPEVQLTCYQMASRLGKTETVMNIIGHSIDEAPRRILVLYPTNSQAEKWSKETLERELFESSPTLQHMVRGGRRNSSNTILHKIFPGGLINIFGGNSPGEMRRAKGNLIFADEIDALEEQETDEGDQLEILWMRGSEYPDCIKIAASYPSVKGHSKINKLLLESDFRKWFTPCHACAEPFVMLRDHITYPDGEPEKAEILCPKCSAAISDKQRRDMVHAGEWVATQPFTGIAGFWANGMISPHPAQKGFKSHLHWIVEQQLKAERADNPARAKRVLVNTFDAECFEPETIDAPDSNLLMDRREDYNPREMLPAGVLLIQGGVDIQKRWIEVHLWGFGTNKEEWHLEHRRINGPVDSVETWQELERYLHNAKFPHPVAGELKLFGDLKRITCFVDAGHWCDTVLTWTQKMAPLGVYAVQGSPTINAPIVGKPRINAIPKARVYPLGVNEGKEIIYAKLAIGKPDTELDYPEGYVHFPASADINFFDSLTAEHGKEKWYRGELYTHYECPKGKRNEALDCYNYARASATALRPNYGKLAENMALIADDSAKPAPISKSTVAKKNWASDY